MQALRYEDSVAAKVRIDERDKAIDVMVKATFIVCSAFPKFKTTEECLSISARPDVNEPGVPVFPPSPTEKMPVAWRNESEIELDTTDTIDHEDIQSDLFMQTTLSDIALEGNPNPENLPTHTVNKRGSKENDNGAPAHNIEDENPSASERLLALSEEDERRLMEDDSTADEGQASLTEEQQSAVDELKALGENAHVDSKYTLPVSELAVALGEGKSKRRTKTIIAILLDVKGMTEDEQRADRWNHVQKLIHFYGQSWDIKRILDGQESKQKALEGSTDAQTLELKQVAADNDEQRTLIRIQRKEQHQEQDRCQILDDEYGERQSIRLADIESIQKLNSLLRSLYDKLFPKDCPMSVDVEVPKMCTAESRGWCIWLKQKGMDQRCSCNEGFYGEVCEHQMCNGIGHIMYMAGADGVCSNRGDCASHSGTCTCHDGFYHSEKLACEFKHCPASKNGDIDEKCSGHGTCDTLRGMCQCAYGWNGPACEYKSCASSNGVLYEHTSPNVCDGRGVCSPDSGSCSCKAPFFGETCENSKCPRDCMGKGGCDESTGKCSCPEGWWGAACEFVTCPDDCSNGGECNRHDGKCLCREGYSGDRCRKSTRCPVELAPFHTTPHANWYTLWDKPGWMTCPTGQSMYALERNDCEVLDCIESGSCAAPCEGDSVSTAEPIEIRHCYHDLNVYFSMDKEGWSKCEANYFIGGFYRSGSSLYQLQMFKCCSYKGSRWSGCGETDWAMQFNQKGRVVAPEHTFLAGLYRGKEHKLSSIDRAYTCGWVRGY